MNKYRNHSKARAIRSCESKKAYADAGQAMRVGMRAYRCGRCSMWHRASRAVHPPPKARPKRTTRVNRKATQ